MDESKGISYERVSSAALEMLTNGTQPSVRKVLAVTGGNTDTVGKYLKDFFNKRDNEVLSMADELGSSEIAKLLSTQVQLYADRKNLALNEIVDRLNQQLKESIELLNEQESDCKHRVDIAENQKEKALNEYTEKQKLANAKIEAALSDKEKAEHDLKNTIESTSQKIESIKIEADNKAINADVRANNLIESARSEADALVKAANVQINKAESETKLLRQQVKDFTVEQARYELEKKQFEQANIIVNELQIDLADKKTLVVQLQTEKTSFIKDNERLERDLVNAKECTEKLSEAKTQLVELQKQLSQSQLELSQSQRERESLSQALVSSSHKKMME